MDRGRWIQSGGEKEGREGQIRYKSEQDKRQSYDEDEGHRRGEDHALQ